MRKIDNILDQAIEAFHYQVDAEIKSIGSVSMYNRIFYFKCGNYNSTKYISKHATDNDIIITHLDIYQMYQSYENKAVKISINENIMKEFFNHLDKKKRVVIWIDNASEYVEHGFNENRFFKDKLEYLKRFEYICMALKSALKDVDYRVIRLQWWERISLYKQL